MSRVKVINYVMCEEKWQFFLMVLPRKGITATATNTGPAADPSFTQTYFYFVVCPPMSVDTQGLSAPTWGF